MRRVYVNVNTRGRFPGDTSFNESHNHLPDLDPSLDRANTGILISHANGHVGSRPVITWCVRLRAGDRGRWASDRRFSSVAISPTGCSYPRRRPGLPSSVDRTSALNSLLIVDQ